MMKEALRHPVCNLCDIKVKSMEVLGTHMKNVHGESDHMRIKMVENMFSSTSNQESSLEIVKIYHKSVDFSCTECGIMFDTNEQQKTHNKEHHSSKLNVK